MNALKWCVWPLARAGADVIVVDTAHGHSRGVIERVRWVKQNYPNLDVIGGNIATGDAARAMVEAGLASLGMGDARVIAMTPRQAGDVLLPDVERPIPYADGKAAALAAQADGARVLGAFGDSTFDLAMMAVSDVPVAVRPKATLRARAGEVPTLVEIGR